MFRSLKVHCFRVACKKKLFQGFQVLAPSRLSDRHCQINDAKNGNINENKNDLLTAFHEQIWDNIHFYLAHLFDIGLREKNTDFKQENQEFNTEEKRGSNEDKWGCFEKRFKQQRIMIETKRKKFPRFSARFGPVSSKFVIETVQQTQKQPNVNVGKCGDGMSLCLIASIHLNIIYQLSYNRNIS